MHKEESGKDVKALFGEGTAREYLDYFTFLFPRLLLHCYSTVESKAKEQFAEYFGQYQKPTAEKDTPGVDLQGPQMIINFKDVITLPETKVNALKICDISHIFFVDNKHFLNYLLNNGTNVTQLEFSDGSLKFDSVNMILQALPNLIKIAFYRVHYVAPKTNQTIQTETCKKLLELEIYSLKSSNLLPAFFECTTIKKLRVDNPTVTLEEILQRYPKLEELKVELNKEYPVSNGGHLVQNILQLSVLQLGLGDIDDDCIDEIIETLLTFIQHQNELQEFSFITYNNNSFNHFQSFRAELVAHISKLASLTRLEIEGDVLLDGTGLVSFLNTSKLTSIKVRNLKTVSNFRSLNVVTLKVLHIQVNSQLKPYDIFSDLQVILKKHPKIIDLKIELKDSEVKLSFLELIEKLLHFGGLKRFEILSNKYGLRAEDICHLKALNNLQYWKINEHVNLTEVAP